MESTDLPAELRKPVSRIFRVLAGIIAIVGLLSLALSGVLYYFGARTFLLNFSTLIDLSVSALLCFFGGYIAIYGKTAKQN